MPNFSGADLMMTENGGKTHAPMKVAKTAGVGADGHTVIITPKSQLGSGSFFLACRVVSTDPRWVAGNYAVAVEMRYKPIGR